MEHTPGPWSLNPGDHCLIGGRRGMSHSNIAKTIVIPGHGIERYAIAEANASLIAAAPDMLAALEAMLDRFGVMSDGCIKMAADAIAKAKGEAK